MNASIEYQWDGSAGRVSVTSPLVTADWQVSADGDLRCVRLTNVTTGWADPLTGRSTAATLADVTVDDGPDGIGRLSLHVRPVGTTLRVRWTIEAHPRHATIRQWAEFTNIGDTEVVVERIPVLGLALGPVGNGLEASCGLGRRPYGGAERQADWYTWRTVPLRPGVVDAVRSGYRKEATWLGLSTPGGGPGLYVGWEANAEACCEFGDLAGDGRVGVDCALRPEYRLPPGQTLVGPAGFAGLAHGDLDELSYRCHRYVEDRLAPKIEDERFPYVEFNSWGYGDDIDADGMLHCLDVCERLGVELFVVDFGWEDPDWRPLADRFPQGLAPLAEEAHKRRLLFGIHLSFGNVSSLSPMYAEHPEWANGPGKWAYRKEGEVFGLTLGNPETREWIVEKLISILDDNHVDYFLTDHFLWGPANPDVQELHATNDYTTVVEGFDRVIDRVRELRPEVVIEHCDDGLALPTFQMIRQHETSIGTDAPGALPERIGTHRISRVLPPRYLDHYAPDRPMGDWEIRSHLFGGPLILMTPIHELAPDSTEWQVLERNIALYKEIRHRMVRGKVLHLLEPRAAERVGDCWDGWDAIGSYDELTDTAVVLVFRLGDVAAERVVPLHGLRPETSYRVHRVDADTSFAARGSELMRDGLRLDLPSSGQTAARDAAGRTRASEVVLLEPAESRE